MRIFKKLYVDRCKSSELNPLVHHSNELDELELDKLELDRVELQNRHINCGSLNPPYKITPGLPPESQYKSIYKSSYSDPRITHNKMLPDNTLNTREFYSCRKY